MGTYTSDQTVTISGLTNVGFNYTINGTTSTYASNL
jgi:hypothetical protein